MTGVRTIGALLASMVAVDPTRPILTFYDDGTGERTELSGATLMNWVAKTANLLTDDCAVGAGDRVAVALPPHWQTAAVLLGCWSTGATVTTEPEPADVAFVHVDWATADWPATERYSLGLHPMALPSVSVPTGYLDFTGTVRSHGDRFVPPVPVTPETDALVWSSEPGGARRAYTHDQILAVALDRAAGHHLDGGRVLVDAGAYPDPVDWLLTPLAGGATIVLCRNLDAARTSARADTERVTRQLI